MGKEMAPTAQVDIVLVQHLLNYWDGRGVDMDQLWRVLDIDPQLPLPRWVLTDRVADAYDFVARELNDSLLAFDLGIYMAERDMPLQRLLRCAQSLKKGIEALIPYVYLSTGSLRYQINAVQNGAVTISVERHPERHVSPLQLAAAVVIMAGVCRNALGASYDLGDLCMHLPESEVSDRKRAEELTNIAVNKTDGFYMLEISREAWERPGPDPQPVLFKSVQRELIRQDQRFREHLELYTELKDILEMCLIRRNVTQEGVADQLGISVRNLQRRLRALGTTYQNLLDEARQGLSMKLICEGDMPLYEVAYKVGYTEPSAFYKAFRRWTGSTPGDYRQAYLSAISAISVEDE
ncbi:helix-turn-helix domain-containing protein [Thalassolituus sp.]|uniref:helix-turn-helix domain-containing protein n=1 Tax=Thalassolituus sp. TaxID=2030822 RepID=UPI003512A220